MSVFKCKMCGGALEISEGMKVCECEYCGTTQTVPSQKDENIQALFNRANILRMKSEFDKAEQLYEKIIQNSPDEPEAHWGLILCKFGIEYVEDPATFKRIPTCHRTSFDSIIADDDYKEALRCADSVQRDIYEREAREIDRLQKEILALSAKEEPYDVFICYKESDNGSRTPDSVIANDIYYQLTNEGFKVFYAAISLENKLGSAYEPCIFAALNSAKVMLAIGTKPEYFTAVWVRNEWSRFLKMMKKDRSKLLIPCYKDMDAYELPEEFAHLQAQDMSKIGFINDLVRGIKKVIVKEDKKPAAPAAPVSSGNANVNSLLRRVFIFLEDGDWSSADEYCEKVLDLDPENGEAYLGKLMAELKVSKRDNLKNCAQPFDGSGNYQKVMRYGDDKLKAEMQACIKYIKERIENARLTGIYNSAVSAMKSAKREDTYKSAAAKFRTIPGFKDADALAEQCLEKAEICRKDEIYSSARSMMNKNTVSDCEAAIAEFRTISGWRDADEQIDICQRKIEEIKAKEEADRLERERQEEQRRIAAEKAVKKRKKIIAIITTITVVCVAFAIVLVTVIIPESKYNVAINLYNEGRYDEAIAAFEALGGYKDSETQIENCQTAIKDKDYDNAVALMNAGKYDEAAEILYEIKDYKDSSDKLDEIIAEPASISAKNSAFISAGDDHTVGLKQDGTVVAVGDNYGSRCNVSGWKDIIAVSAGYRHTVGLKKDGTVVAVGGNGKGQCDVSGWKNIIAVSAGYRHTVGLKKDGTVVAVGNNDEGQCNVSGWRDIIAVSAGGYHTVGLKKDGTVVAVGENYDGQCDVSDWRNIIAVSAGEDHTVGLKKDGTVVVAGDNDYGQCNVSGWKLKTVEK